MDSLTFIASLVDSLAWPVIALLVVLVLRDPLGKLIREMRRLKFRDLEAEFGAAVDELKAEASDTLPLSAVAAADPGVARRLAELADASPNAAVLDAWQEVERAARARIAAAGITLDENTATPFSQIESVLADKDLIETRHIKVFSDLRRLRNKVAHARGYQVSPEQARDYVELALGLAAQIARPSASTGG